VVEASRADEERNRAGKQASSVSVVSLGPFTHSVSTLNKTRPELDLCQSFSLGPLASFGFSSA
jgi:hypothetical protein